MWEDGSREAPSYPIAFEPDASIQRYFIGNPSKESALSLLCVPRQEKAESELPRAHAQSLLRSFASE